MTIKQHVVLIVDDEPVLRNILRQRLSADGYRCQEAGGAEEALERLVEDTAELVLLDIKMPCRSGVDLLSEIKLRYPDTAVIMVTAVTDTGTVIQCMRDGAYDYLVKPFNLDEVTFGAKRALEKRRLELEKRAYQEHLEQMVEERTTELRQAIERIKLASLDTIHRLAQAAEYKDEGTGAHIKRIGQYCASIARRLGLNQTEVENILYAAPMHDVGKIGVPDRILLKPGKLDSKEWAIMKQHTVIGEQILAGSDIEFIRLAEVIALTHHERWDGSGYPRGLRGTDIPLAGRMTAVADVFDALISTRPYKEPFSIEESLDIIREGRGNNFDPEVVDAFLAIEDVISGVKEAYKDERESLLVGMVG